jgi:hypothetical protein
VKTSSRRRRFPTDRERKAVAIGANELVGRAEWQFRTKPRALARARKIYKAACLKLYRCLERSGR